MNTWAVVDWTGDVWHFIVRMLVAVICGFVIGLERKSRSKEAGIRTHAIVCLAACLFMILSKYLAEPLFSDISGSKFTGDATRIASQVVTGIGFLGAGIIMYRRDVMHGLTTAAGIWATAAIGMAIGSGFVVTGVCAAVIIVLIQLVLHIRFVFELVAVCILQQLLRLLLNHRTGAIASIDFDDEILVTFCVLCINFSH